MATKLGRPKNIENSKKRLEIIKENIPFCNSLRDIERKTGMFLTKEERKIVRHQIKPKHFTESYVGNSKYKNLIGKTCEYLTILSLESKQNRNHPHKVYFATCKCKCGKIIETQLANIINKCTKSCGCIRKDTVKKNVNSPYWKGYGEISLSYFNRIKRHSKRYSRTLDFDITIEDIWGLFLKQNRKCALTNLDIYFGETCSNIAEGNASLDRIDSSKGYIIGNVQWVHKDINLIKMDFSVNELINYSKLILEHNGYQVYKR